MTIGLIALIAPPNTNDSMSYHMSRVVHWQQNHSIAHYPTHILRQIVLPPGAELAILHLQILSESDRFANLVQWLSVAAGLCGVSLIAKELGADVRGQILSVVVCATLPMVILQASSTQNDAVEAFWMTCLVYFLLVMRRRQEWFYPYLVGMSLGLALLTKATAYLLAPPFLIWFGRAPLANEARPCVETAFHCRRHRPRTELGTLHSQYYVVRPSPQSWARRSLRQSR